MSLIQNLIQTKSNLIHLRIWFSNWNIQAPLPATNSTSHGAEEVAETSATRRTEYV